MSVLLLLGFEFYEQVSETLPTLYTRITVKLQKDRIFLLISVFPRAGGEFKECGERLDYGPP